MAFRLFGFTFGQEQQINTVQKFLEPSFSEPTLDLQSGGFISPTGKSFQIGQVVKSENDAISQYRDIAKEPEVDLAVEEIISEMLVFDQIKQVVTLNMDDLEIPNNIKKILDEEFNYILGLMDFKISGHNIAKRWYVDGRINYIMLIDEQNPTSGIMQLQYIDPYKIKKIRDIERGYGKDGTPVIKSTKEYYIYNELGIEASSVLQQSASNMNVQGTIALSTDCVAHSNSGIYDPERGFIISALDPAVKTVNSLRHIEESYLIYAITRAPERRVFYIDVGNLSKPKAEQYVKEIADRYRTKILYDPSTGKIKNDKRFLAMTEDFWIPRSGDGRSTQIDTLPAGDAFTGTEQQEYYKDKLWQALKVPSARFSGNSIYNNGLNVTRDELRFFKYIQSLRVQFNSLFLQLLQKQLILKGIIDLGDWEYIKDNLKFEYAQDNYFTESVENEKLQVRFSLLAGADQFVGKYFGYDYIYKEVLRVRQESAEDLLDDAQKAWELINQQQKTAQMGQIENQVATQEYGQELSQNGVPLDNQPSDDVPENDSQQVETEQAPQAPQDAQDAQENATVTKAAKAVKKANKKTSNKTDK